MGLVKPFAGGYIDVITFQFLAWSKGNRMDNNIQSIPVILEGREYIRYFIVSSAPSRCIAWAIP